MTTPGWLRWRDWSLGAKSAAALAMPLTLLVVALLFSYRLQRDIAAADADVRRALVIQAEIQTLHLLIAESATGVRGFLLTGRDEFLAPDRAARAALPSTLSTLRSNIRDPDMRQRLARIEGLLDRKLESLQSLRETGRNLSATDLQVHLLDSKRVLDELRVEIRAMYAREADLVVQYSDAVQRTLQRNLWADVITSVLVLVTGMAAFVLLFGGVVSRVKRLTINAERLTRGEPLQALPSGRDELGLLAERLQNTSLLLATRAAEARSASEAKSQFLSRTSHELRTPLNAILGFAQLLERDLKNSTQRAQVSHITDAGLHLLSLIDEVLDIARIESGELKLVLQVQPLGPMLQELRELIAPLANQHGIHIQLGESLTGLAVQADRRRLRQVLLNLLSNAVKYNRAGGSVQVQAERRDGQVWLAVSDTGMGIAPAELTRLFTPFDRLGAEGGAVTGTGLGLALSQQLALCMGGGIEVQSTLGEGSIFSLHLPVASQAEPAQLQPAYWAEAVPNTAAAHRRCVLVIEDNPSNLALLQAVVARCPEWHLVAARDGHAGLARARELAPALILLDLHLQGLDSMAVLALLQAEAVLAQSHIVMMGADTQPDTTARLRAAGAHNTLPKPLAVPSVLALLDRSPP